jgi:ankyrin repeat domain-containing protein 50
MLLNIEGAFVEDARRVLMWLCFSKRPLTVRELIDGVAIKLGDDARLNRKRRLQDEHDILQICPGFINVAPSSNIGLDTQNDKLSYVVSIAHYSVQEYLESDRICQQKTAFFSMRSTGSALQIAQMCLVYLLDPVLSKAKVTHSTLNELPLAEYAAKYWYVHVKGSDTFSSDIHFYVMQLYRDLGHAFRNSIIIYDHDQPFHTPFKEEEQKIASKVYYAALLGFDSVLSELLKARNEQFSQAEEYIDPVFNNNLDINSQGGRYGNTLQAALAGGHEKVVQLLLDKDSDVNA